MKKQTFLPIIIGICVACYHPAKRVVLIKPAVIDNRLSKEWQAALVTRMSKEEIDSFAAIRRPLTPEETAWIDLFQSRTTYWAHVRDSVGIPFPGVPMSDTTYVLTGFLGVDDAFTFQHQTVCFDVTAFNTNYGAASIPENVNRADRIFAHEYTHLLHKSWAKKNNLVLRTFRDSVIWECLYEGMGMFRSLSERWMPKNGVLPDETQQALKELYPQFIKYISLVEKNPSLTDEQKREVEHNLSRGPVQKKWGAFTVGIWLGLEFQEGGNKKLSEWINKGPDAVFLLAKKYLGYSR